MNLPDYNQEIDSIEERDDSLPVFEFKRNPKEKIHLSKTFLNAYSNHEYKVISPGNIHEFTI